MPLGLGRTRAGRTLLPGLPAGYPVPAPPLRVVSVPRCPGTRLLQDTAAPLPACGASQSLSASGTHQSSQRPETYLRGKVGLTENSPALPNGAAFSERWWEVLEREPMGQIG